MGKTYKQLIDSLGLLFEDNAERNRSLESEVQTLRTRCDELEQQAAADRETIDCQADQVKHLEEDNKKARQYTLELQLNLKTILDKYTCLQKESVELMQKEEEINSYREQVERLHTAVVRLKGDKDVLTADNARLSSELADVRRQLADEIAAGNDTVEQLKMSRQHQLEYEAQLRELEKVTRQASRNSGNDGVPVKKLIDGLKKRARMHGLQHAARLFDDLSQMLLGVKEWTANVREIEQFFEEEQQLRRQGENIVAHSATINVNSPGNIIGKEIKT